MEMYKKKSLKFCNKEISRDSRHAETLKARESSRFERLSMLREISDESIQEDKVLKQTECKDKKKPMSRLEVLFKWKQEKQIKKELEKKKIKPFYSGCQSLKNSYNKNLPSLKLPSAAQPNISFNTSKTVKSRLVTSGASFLSSRIPNNSKLDGTKHAPGAKINCVSTKETSKKFGNSASSINQVGSVVRVAKSNNKDPVVKSIIDTGSKIKRNGISLVAKSQESYLPKPTFSKQPSRPATKIGIPILSKGIPVQKAQSLKPVAAINQKPVSAHVSKLHEKKIPGSVENVTSKRKGYCFKKIPSEPAGISKKCEPAGTSKKFEPAGISKKFEPAGDEKKVASKLDLVKKTNSCEGESVFDCDVNMIKHAPSFAPPDFKFLPPKGLPELSFDEEAFERIKKIFSRPSTPSKPCERSPSICPKDLKANDSPLVDKICDKETTDHSVNQEILKNSATEEELQKESDIKLVGDILVADKDENVSKEGDSKVAGNEFLKTSELACFDSPLDAVDLNKIKEIIAKFEDESNDDDLPQEQDTDKYIEKKPLSALPKRASILKNISVLNSISEITETDECLVQSPAVPLQNILNCAFTPRRSQRLSKVAIAEESSNSAITVTPRRSMRLQRISKKCQFGVEDILSPFEEKKSKLKVAPRHSMKLIDFNTPEKDIKEAGPSNTNITADFEKLCLEERENINPNDFLINFENSPNQIQKSKKISLLYSPEKIRTSTRRSIRGDLMSFSPCN